MGQGRQRMLIHRSESGVAGLRLGSKELAEGLYANEFYRNVEGKNGKGNRNLLKLIIFARRYFIVKWYNGNCVV